MTDHKTIANRYIDLWNERAPQSRRGHERPLEDRQRVRVRDDPE